MLKSMFLIRYILVYFGIFDPQPIINQGYSEYQSFWICLSSLKLPITLGYLSYPCILYSWSLQYRLQTENRNWNWKEYGQLMGTGALILQPKY